MFDVKQAMRELVEKEGSDLHLKVDSAPLFRVNGELVGAEGGELLTAGDTEGALKQLLDDDHKLDEFAREHEVDFSFEISGVARYRINAFQQLDDRRARAARRRHRTGRRGARNRAAHGYDRLR